MTLESGILDIFFIEFRDPIFGLVVLVAAVLVIAVFSYAWGVFKSKDEKAEIAGFLKKFGKSQGLSDENKQLLINSGADTATMCFLAGTFSKSGYFEKAINVYAVALERAKNRAAKEQIFTDLGQTYFKAGFLERAKSVFLEALKISPRNQIALKSLTIIFEKLKDYEGALQALDALQELGSDVRAQTAYIKALQILADKSKDEAAKIGEILALKDEFALVRRMAMERLNLNGSGLKDFSDFPPLGDVLDLVYYQNSPVNLADPEYKSLFFIKGMSDEDGTPLGFELEVLKKLKAANYDKAALSFNYVCKSCKNAFPMHFYRCPMCSELGSVQILPHITEKPDENSMPF